MAVVRSPSPKHVGEGRFRVKLSLPGAERSQGEDGISHSFGSMPYVGHVAMRKPSPATGPSDRDSAEAVGAASRTTKAYVRLGGRVQCLGCWRGEQC